MKKILYLGFFISLSFSLSAQESGYSWPLPSNWVREMIPFPLKFAPDIPYPGLEEIHFMPGWKGDTLKEQQWSYIFIWKLDTLISFDAPGLRSDLYVYFNGLTEWVMKNNNLDLPVPPVYTCRVEEKSPGNFTGIVTLTDVFFTLKPITLNLKINTLKDDLLQKTILFFMLSPKPYENPLWNQLDAHQKEFRLIR
jgi:hypothetical protein